LISMDEWEALQEKYRKYEDDELTPEEAEAVDEVWAEYLADPGMAKIIEGVIREQLVERKD
jgi:hypothetical protein